VEARGPRETKSGFAFAPYGAAALGRPSFYVAALFPSVTKHFADGRRRNDLLPGGWVRTAHTRGEHRGEADGFFHSRSRLAGRFITWSTPDGRWR